MFSAEKALGVRLKEGLEGLPEDKIPHGGRGFTIVMGVPFPPGKNNHRFFNEEVLVTALKCSVSPEVWSPGLHDLIADFSSEENRIDNSVFTLWVILTEKCSDKTEEELKAILFNDMREMCTRICIALFSTY